MIWQTKKLGDLYDITSSKRVFKSEWKKSGVPFYRAREIVKLAKQGYVDNDLFISEEMYKNYSEKYGSPKEGDIMVTGVGTLGICYVVKKNDKFYFKDGNIIWLKTKGDIDSRFVEYAFKSDMFKSQINDGKGATVGTYTIIKAKNTLIPLPLVAEQKRIVKKLDDVFEKVAEAKENAEKNLQNSKELLGSYLRQVFTSTGKDWENKSLKELAEYSIGLTYSPKDVSDKGIIVLRSSNVQNDKLDFSDIVRVNRKVKESLKVRGGDILMCSRNGSKRLVGKTARIEGISEEMTFGTFMMIVRGESNDYLYWFFKSSEFRRQIAGGENTMINQITRYMLDDVSVSTPPKSQRKIIAKKLEALSIETKKLEKIYEQKLADLEELKKSVLKKAFSGELVETISPIQVDQLAVPSPYFRNQVHAAIIDQVARDGGSTTEVAVAKYDHLLQEMCGLKLGYQFQTHQFGPFDAQIKRLVSSGLGRNQWFTKRNGMIVFGSNVGALLSRQSNLYRSAQSAMKELARLGITQFNAESVELLSTVCHSIKETGLTSLQSVRDFMSQWQTDGNRTKAEKFSSERTQKCLDFIIKNNLHLKLLQTI